RGHGQLDRLAEGRTRPGWRPGLRALAVRPPGGMHVERWYRLGYRAASAGPARLQRNGPGPLPRRDSPAVEVAGWQWLQPRNAVLQPWPRPVARRPVR